MVLAVTLLLLAVIKTESVGANVVEELGLQWSHEGRIKCSKCVHIHPKEFNYAWANNYLCTKKDHGIQWSNNGTIEGMLCEKVAEESEPGEQNNYLCVSNSSTWEFRFSANSTIEGMDCILMNVPFDPDSWHDNYLCVTTTPTSASTTTTTATTAVPTCQIMADTVINNGILLRRDKASTTAVLCANACIQEPACRGMNFLLEGDACFLLSTAGQQESVPGTAGRSSCIKT